jgi:hypothetical protein
VRDSEILRGAWSKTVLEDGSVELVLSDGIRVVRTDRGVFEDGRVLWILVYGAPSSWYARNVAERFGRITESDEAEDGARSFAVVRPAEVES